tara:strand:+ start:136 stop:264 length:129 start_codon:yes stop_codon:yes gene_type:complete
VLLAHDRISLQVAGEEEKKKEETLLPREKGPGLSNRMSFDVY